MRDLEITLSSISISSQCFILANFISQVSASRAFKDPDGGLLNFAGIASRRIIDFFSISRNLSPQHLLFVPSCWLKLTNLYSLDDLAASETFS